MRFGCVCDNGPSHVMSSAAIGRALMRRGHEFVLFGMTHLQPWIEKEGIPASYLPHSTAFAARLATVAKGQSFSKGEIVAALEQDARFVLRELPAVMEKARVDCMIVDANLPAGVCVAEAQSLPFVTFCSALPPHEESAVPPVFLPWPYDTGIWARLRNTFAYAVRDWIVAPLKSVLNDFRRQHGLRPYATLSDSLSPLAQVSQLVAEFDFPRTQLPACFHYVGPYFRSTSSDVAFPFERLDGRPLVYAALGTTLDVDATVWTAIAWACAPLDVQLVIVSPKALPGLPGNPMVVPYAPQEELLAKAAVFITHAGLNSALEGLAHGVPMLAMPFVADQMGVTARIVYRGAGLSYWMDRRSETLAGAVARLLNDGGYRERSGAIAKVIQASGGADRAAEIIEQVALLRGTCADAG